MEDVEGLSVVLLSNARVVLTTTDDKQPRCKLLGEIANDDNSKEDAEGNTDVPCSKAQLELIATGEDSLLGGRLERTTDFDTTGNDDTSLDDTNGNSGVLSSFAIPELSVTNDELLVAKVLERDNFEDDVETEDSEGTAAIFWPATFEFPATSRTLLALALEWSEDLNTAADVINTQVHVAVIKDNNHNF